MVMRGLLLALACVALLGAGARGQSASPAKGGARREGDWPQWRGPDRTGVSKESGLLPRVAAAGPALLWTASNLGAGYGSLAVSGDRIFVQGTRSRTAASS